jgi:hypothetical protein
LELGENRLLALGRLGRGITWFVGESDGFARLGVLHFGQVGSIRLFLDFDNLELPIRAIAELQGDNITHLGWSIRGIHALAEGQSKGSGGSKYSCPKSPLP